MLTSNNNQLRERPRDNRLCLSYASLNATTSQGERQWENEQKCCFYDCVNCKSLSFTPYSFIFIPHSVSYFTPMPGYGMQMYG